MPDDPKFRALHLPREQSEEPNEDDVQDSLYEFYLLLQRLKAGGMSFDTFIERATTWAITRAAQK
jgi:hypothetical protein